MGISRRISASTKAHRESLYFQHKGFVPPYIGRIGEEDANPDPQN